MILLKRIGIFTLAILLLLVVISFFLPGRVHVQRVAVINAQPEVVFRQVNDLHNWNKWMPWNKMDPKMEIKYYGPEKGTGAGYSWSSDIKQVGKGKITIIDSKPDESVVTELNFMEHGISTASFRMEPVDHGTKVIWGMDMDMGMNPFARYLGLFMDQMIGGDFEKGLIDLKTVSEQYAPPLIPEINMTPDSSSALTNPS